MKYYIHKLFKIIFVRNPYIIDQLPLDLKVIIKKKAKQTGGKQKEIHI